AKSTGVCDCNVGGVAEALYVALYPTKTSYTPAAALACTRVWPPLIPASPIRIFILLNAPVLSETSHLLVLLNPEIVAVAVPVFESNDSTAYLDNMVLAGANQI